MSPKDIIKLKGLIERVLAYDAREIQIKDGSYTPVRLEFIKKYQTNPEDIIVEIKNLFDECRNTFPTTESIRAYALKHLKILERDTDSRVNPSYKTLRKRMEKGNYDVVASMGLTEML